MKRVFRDRNSSQKAILAAALLMAVLAVTGCGRNEGSLPSGYVPEGVEGEESFLFVSLDSVSGNSSSPPGPAVTVTVIDRTNANSYQIYRRFDGEEAFDHAVEYVGPLQGTFNQGVQFFQVLDRDWQENRGVDYIGRGTILGNESKSSPLSTVGRIPAGTFDDLQPVQFEQIYPLHESEVDSMLTWMTWCLPVEVDPTCANPQYERLDNKFSWEPVPGATRYLIQVVRTDGVSSIIAVTPPDGSTSFNVRSLEGLLLQSQVPLSSPSTFFWFVQALDADSRVIGYTPFAWLFGVVPICGPDPELTCPDEP